MQPSKEYKSNLNSSHSHKSTKKNSFSQKIQTFEEKPEEFEDIEIINETYKKLNSITYNIGELNKFKNDILVFFKERDTFYYQKLKQYKSNLDISEFNFNSTSKTINSNYQNIIQSQAAINSRLDQLKNYEIFSTKTNDKLTSHEIRINNLREDLSKTCQKYDKIYLDNLELPGFIGRSAKYKNCQSFFSDVIKDLAKLNKFREKNIMDLAKYKEKLEGIINTFNILVDNNNKSQMKYINENYEKIKNDCNKMMQILEERIKDIRVENSKYTVNLITQSEELSKKWGIMQNIKNELMEQFNYNINKYQMLTDDTRKSFDEFKIEYNTIRKKFMELVEFIKDVRFRKNLGGNIKKREIKSLIKKINSNRNNGSVDIDPTNIHLLNDTASIENLDFNKIRSDFESEKNTNHGNCNSNRNNNFNIAKKSCDEVSPNKLQLTKQSHSPEYRTNKEKLNKSYSLSNNKSKSNHDSTKILYQNINYCNTEDNLKNESINIMIKNNKNNKNEKQYRVNGDLSGIKNQSQFECNAKIATKTISYNINNYKNNNKNNNTNNSKLKNINETKINAQNFNFQINNNNFNNKKNNNEKKEKFIKDNSNNCNLEHQNNATKEELIPNSLKIAKMGNNSNNPENIIQSQKESNTENKENINNNINNNIKKSNYSQLLNSNPETTRRFSTSSLLAKEKQLASEETSFISENCSVNNGIYPQNNLTTLENNISIVSSTNSMLNNNINANNNRFTVSTGNYYTTQLEIANDRIIKELASELEQSTAKKDIKESDKKQIDNNFKNLCKNIEPMNLLVNTNNMDINNKENNISDNNSKNNGNINNTPINVNNQIYLNEGISSSLALNNKISIVNQKILNLELFTKEKIVELIKQINLLKQNNNNTSTNNINSKFSFSSKELTPTYEKKIFNVNSKSKPNIRKDSLNTVIGSKNNLINDLSILSNDKILIENNKNIFNCANYGHSKRLSDITPKQLSANCAKLNKKGTLKSCNSTLQEKTCLIDINNYSRKTEIHLKDYIESGLNNKDLSYKIFKEQNKNLLKAAGEENFKNRNNNLNNVGNGTGGKTSFLSFNGAEIKWVDLNKLVNNQLPKNRIFPFVSSAENNYYVQINNNDNK